MHDHCHCQSAIMEKSRIILLVLCLTHTSFAVDYCRAFHPEAECLPNCVVSDGYRLYDEVSFLCEQGQCCEAAGTAPPPPGDEPLVVDSSACGVTGRRMLDPGNRVSKRSVGREVPTACTWPWLVSVNMESSDIASSHVMTGVLVSNNTVLVHGETFSDFADSPLNLQTEIVVGEYHLNMDGDEKGVYSVSTTDIVDIGDFKLLRFSGVDLDMCVRPVCLSNKNDSTSLRLDQCKLIGWSTIETGNGSTTLVPVPLQTTVSIDDATFCSRIFEFLPETYSPTDLCLNMDNNVTTTEGDRGNAIICPDQNQHWHLKGILTQSHFGSGAVSLGPFAVDVTEFADQIKGVL